MFLFVMCNRFWNMYILWNDSVELIRLCITIHDFFFCGKTIKPTLSNFQEYNASLLTIVTMYNWSSNLLLTFNWNLVSFDQCLSNPWVPVVATILLFLSSAFADSPICIHQLSITVVWDYQCKRRKGLFWLIVSEALVHG